MNEVNPEKTGLSAKVEQAQIFAQLDTQFAREGEIFELPIIERRILDFQQIAGQSILEIGRLLAWTKERVGHGDFAKSLERMKINHRTAQGYMQVYAKMGTKIGTKIGTKSNAQPAAHLGIEKALQLARAFDDEELQDLLDGEEVKGHRLEDLAEMSKRELIATLRSEKQKSAQELEAARKQADALQKRNDKLAGQTERYESGSDKGWEFTGRWLSEMRNKNTGINSLAIQLEKMAGDWAKMVDEGDERALAGHPFICSELTFMHNLVAGSLDLCNDALQKALAADHPHLEFPAGTEYAAMGFSPQNLPKNMKYTPKDIESADSGTTELGRTAEAAEENPELGF
ncbi:DUF3102 domain-containing protein [Candidatus Haliotispira prima]|uniref:DUF3102 domain-containing protein n=1 Tax=Candidatus Haliotispira prima TaxID=3034016 RepID=A0ABY8MJB6_9SPIO|nr:DUF3102 domain-containing protein [Candidatus Haliotispira prima]